MTACCQAVKQSDDLLFREEVTPAKQQAHLEATTCLAGVMHATGDSEGADAQCQTALTLVHDDDASGSVLPKFAVAAALKQAAAFRLAQVKALQSFNVSFNDAHASCCSICKTARAVLRCCVGLSRCDLRQVENASFEHHVLCKVALTPRWSIWELSLTLFPCTSLLWILLSQPCMFAATVLQAGADLRSFNDALSMHLDAGMCTFRVNCLKRRACLGKLAQQLTNVRSLAAVQASRLQSGSSRLLQM